MKFLYVIGGVVRLVAPDTRESMPGASIVGWMGPEDVQAGIRLYAPKGCPNCTDGYKGRLGIYQVMPVTEAIGRIIMAGGNAIEIADEARKQGIWDLRRAGLEKARAGMTSLEEINSVTID